MYPLKFKKNLVKKVWGGRKFKEVLNMELPDNDLYGESWEVSSHKGGLSYVDNGEFQGKSPPWKRSNCRLTDGKC